MMLLITRASVIKVCVSAALVPVAAGPLIELLLLLALQAGGHVVTLRSREAVRAVCALRVLRAGVLNLGTSMESLAAGVLVAARKEATDVRAITLFPLPQMPALELL